MITTLRKFACQCDGCGATCPTANTEWNAWLTARTFGFDQVGAAHYCERCQVVRKNIHATIAECECDGPPELPPAAWLALAEEAR